ncbi:hypothetical protein [Stenotrophomonas sp.]|uniref:hypothetical protein n=1 Tax=Stenotrophomonas sp. TaxID=69392 RepID=UPI0028A122D7|nr:hypothetical protein [Stenotrophomonas sp.]
MELAINDLASIRLQAIARNDAIVAEGRDCFGLGLTREQAAQRVMEARWPNLSERAAHEAAIARYEVGVEV